MQLLYCCMTVLEIRLSLEYKTTLLQATQAIVFFPYLVCDFPHASVTLDSKCPYCTPDTVNTDST